MREQSKSNVSKKGISKSTNLWDVTVKTLSSFFESTLPNSSSLAFCVYTELMQMVFALFQVFVELISEAGVYDEDQKGNIY